MPSIRIPATTIQFHPLVPIFCAIGQGIYRDSVGGSDRL